MTDKKKLHEDGYTIFHDNGDVSEYAAYPDGFMDACMLDLCIRDPLLENTIAGINVVSGGKHNEEEK